MKGKMVIELLTVIIVDITILNLSLDLPHDAHIWLLGPLFKQNHIKKQFNDYCHRTLRFLCFACQKGIVEVCKMNTLHNTNPYGIQFIIFGIYFQSHSLAHCIKGAPSVEQLYSQSSCLIKQLRILLRTRCNEYVINGVTHEEIA